MRKTINIRTMVITSIVLVIAVTMQAQYTSGRHFKAKSFHTKGFVVPDLTEDQEAKIKKIRLEQMKSMQALKLDIDEIKIQLKRLETADSPDLKAIEKKINELFEVKKKMAMTKASGKQKIRKLLTDDQRLFFDMHGNSGHMHGGHRCISKDGFEKEEVHKVIIKKDGNTIEEEITVEE